MTFDEGKWVTYDAPELSVFQLADAAASHSSCSPGPSGPRVGGVRGRGALDRRAARRRTDDHLLRRADGDTAHQALGVITHASRPGLVTTKIPLPSKLQVPASASSLLEYRFGEAGRDAIGSSSRCRTTCRRRRTRPRR